MTTEEETRRSVKLPNYFSVLPAFRELYKSIIYDYPNLFAEQVAHTYRSSAEEPASQAFIQEFLRERGLLESDAGPSQGYWPGGRQGSRQLRLMLPR